MKAWELLEKLKKIDITKLEEKKGLGPILIENFQDFLHSSRYNKLMEGFKSLDNKNSHLDLKYNIQKKLQNSQGQDLSVVITGSFDKSRNEISSILELNGFKISSSVSKKTSFLLCGEKPGSSLGKAEKLGIKIFKNIEDLFKANEIELKIDSSSNDDGLLF